MAAISEKTQTLAAIPLLRILGYAQLMTQSTFQLLHTVNDLDRQLDFGFDNASRFILLPRGSTSCSVQPRIPDYRQAFRKSTAEDGRIELCYELLDVVVSVLHKFLSHLA